MLHSHPEIEISFKFIPKILMSKECIHFFGPLCMYPPGDPLKAISHIACRAALIHICYDVPLPCSDSVVSFVKVRVVAGNTRTASTTV